MNARDPLPMFRAIASNGEHATLFKLHVQWVEAARQRRLASIGPTTEQLAGLSAEFTRQTRLRIGTEDVAEILAFFPDLASYLAEEIDAEGIDSREVGETVREITGRYFLGCRLPTETDQIDLPEWEAAISQSGASLGFSPSDER